MTVVLALCFIWPGCGPSILIDHCSMALWDKYIAIVFSILWAKLVALSEVITNVSPLIIFLGSSLGHGFDLLPGF